MEPATIYFKPVAPLGTQRAYPLTAEFVGDLDGRTDPVTRLYAASTPREVDIPGGWGAERMSFLFLYTTNRLGQMQKHARVYGYTEELASIPEGANIPDDTKLYFNRTMELTTANYASVGGVAAYTCVNRDHHILLRESTDTYRLRPEDVLQRLAASHALSGMAMHLHGEVRNMVSVMSAGPVVARVYDENPVAWWENIQMALRGDTFGYLRDTPPEEKFNDAANLIRSEHLAHKQFFDRLAINTNYLIDGYITYGDLRTIYELATTVDVSEDVLDMAKSDTSAEGYRNTVYSQAAHHVISALLPVMGMYGVDEIGISTDPDTDEFTITWPGMFADGQLPQQLTDDLPPSFEEAAKIALATLKKNKGWVRMNINAHLDVLNKGVIQVDIDQTREVIHLPLYASARLSTLLAPREVDLEDLGRWVEAVDQLSNIHRRTPGGW